MIRENLTSVEAQIQEACRKAGVRYIRLVRETSDVRNAVIVNSAEEAADYLAGQDHSSASVTP